MKKYPSIADIPPKETGCEAVVKVIEMTPELRSRSNNTTYQHYIFEDDKGARVRGVTFDQHVKSIGRKFILHKKYRISNAQVSNIKEEYVRDEITIQWILKFETLVQELSDPATPSPVQYNFTAIPQLQNFVHVKKAFLDVIGVVVSCTPSKEIATRYGRKRIQKFTIIDTKFYAVTLSLWGESATEYGPLLENELRNFPVVICHKVQVGYFNGPEISTNKGSTILVNPNIPQARELQIWAEKYSTLIQQHTIEHDFTTELPELTIPTVTTRIVDAVPKGITPEVAWIKGSLNLRQLVQSYWHVACKKCQRTSSCDCGQQYKCNECGFEQIAAPRCKFDVEMKDTSGSIYASAYGFIGEQILDTTAQIIAAHDCKGEEVDIDRTQKMLDTKLFLMQVQMQLARNQDENTR